MIAYRLAADSLYLSKKSPSFYGNCKIYYNLSGQILKLLHEVDFIMDSWLAAHKR